MYLSCFLKYSNPYILCPDCSVSFTFEIYVNVMISSQQASDETMKEKPVADEHYTEENSALENDCMLLPHDRVGSDFSWLQSERQVDSRVQKVYELEDEESFLYGNEYNEEKQNKSSTTFSEVSPHGKRQEMAGFALDSQQHPNKSIFRRIGDLLDVKQSLQVTPSSFASPGLDSGEFEKTICQTILAQHT